MYDDLCSRVVRAREIDDVLQQVAGLKESDAGMRRGRCAQEGSRGAGSAGRRGWRTNAAPVRQVRDRRGTRPRRSRSRKARRRGSRGAASTAWRPREWDEKSRRRPMSTDRRIGLEIGLSQGGAEWDARQGGDAEPAATRTRPTPGLRARLEGRGRRVPGRGADVGAVDALRAVRTSAAAGARRGCRVRAGGIAAPGGRSLVGVRPGRRRRREVRVELDEGFMEGVSVSVFEDGGALAVLFRCASERAQRRPRWRRAWPMAWPPACGGWSGSICRTATAPTSIPASGWRMVRLPERPWMPSP